MRILVVAPQPFFTSRGTPFSVYYRTLVLAEQGCEVDVLTYGTGKDVDVPGVRIVRIPRVPWLEPIPIGPSWRKMLLDLPLMLWTIGLLVRRRYDAVDAHEEAVFWCRFLKPLFGFKLIYDMHSSLPQQLTNFQFTTSRWLIGIFRRLEDTCLRTADAVVTVCPDLQAYACDTSGLPERVLLIENSVFEDVRLKDSTRTRELEPRHEPVSFAPGQPVIVYAGTFEVYQGVDMLVRAFAKVLKELPDARLLLIGGTPRQVRSVRSLADSLGLGEACVLTGHLPKTQAMAYTKAASVLVSPRLQGTNTPLKIYEHLASGRPMVATRIWSHTQVLDDSICWLVEPEPGHLAAGIVDALRDEKGSQERVRRALERFEREYSRPQYERKIRRLLEMIR